MDTLPLEILVFIASIDIASYRAMLSVGKFANSVRSEEARLRFKRLFTVCTVGEEVKWTLLNKLHRDDDQPALINGDGSKHWYQHGKLHREHDRPAIMYSNGGCFWYQYGKRHRMQNQPAVVYGSKRKCFGDTQPGIRQEWWQNDCLHRDGDQPAIVDEHVQEWYQHGKRHREHGQPACVYGDDKSWYLNGELHRDGDLPAVVSTKGDRQWYRRGKRYHLGD